MTELQRGESETSVKISVAEVRRRLPEGTEFVGEFVGPINTRLCQPGMKTTRRRVASNTTYEMVSVFLDGPKVGERIYLRWAGVVAREEGGSVHLGHRQDGVEFLKITVAKEEVTRATRAQPA